MLTEIFDGIPGKLAVLPGGGGQPLDLPEYIRGYPGAALSGGPGAARVEGVKIAKIREAVTAPIAITKIIQAGALFASSQHLLTRCSLPKRDPISSPSARRPRIAR